MRPALFVANYIIEYSNKKEYPINNLRLQKLLYFIHARSLVETGQSIFDEQMQKWKYGPVVPKVYHEYKQYGAFNIDDTNTVKKFFMFDFQKNPFDDDTDLEILEYDSNLFNGEEKLLIETTIDALSDYGTFELVDITHDHDLWKCDEDKIQKGEQGICYEDEEVMEFFNNHPEAQIWQEVA